MASSIDNSAWLEWMRHLMGGVSRQSYAATLPPDQFHCLLDDLPLHLIPHGALASLHRGGGQDTRLFLNPECVFCSEGQLPDELLPDEELVSGFARQGTIAWVRDSVAGSLLPFWLSPELDGVVRGLQTSECASAALPDDLRARLSSAGILTSAALVEWRRREWDAAFAKSALLFRQKGYAPLTNLIHPFHVAALRRYYRHLIRTGAIQLGDGQSSRRYVAYNEPVARFFHRQIAATLSAVAGEPLKPSYVYMASYLGGAELRKHVDREQCEFSVTLCLDFSPEPSLETPWPIRLETPTGTVSVYQALGDGLAYRGTRLPHYRDRLGEGQTSTSIFFHYVAAHFTGSLD
jgi:hypothetical protein